MLTSLSTFLTAVGESLKKPLQPAGLFAAIIFLLLQLAFVLPDLAANDQPVALVFLGMSTLWQTVLATILVLTLSYLLLSLAPSILSLMTGEIWADSPMLGALFTWLQNRKRTTLTESSWPEAKSGTGTAGTLSEFQESALDPDPPTDGARTPEEAQGHRRLFEFYTRFPRDPAYIAPTTLGNALNATTVDLWQRYRINMAALWPYMETLLADDKALAARVEHEKASLDFLLNLAFVLNLFAVEYFLVHLWATQQLLAALVWAGFFVVLAYIIYRAAVGKARAWGDAVQVAFDLHRDKLREKLGLAPFKSRAEERATWDKASRWFLWGPSPKMVSGDKPWPDAIFKDEPPPPAPPSLAPTSVASANVEVRIESAFVEPDILVQGPARSPDRVTWYKQLDYSVILNTAAAPDAGGSIPPLDSAFVIITDPRVLFINHNPSVLHPQSWGALPQAAIMTVEGESYKNKLLWQFPRLPARGVRVLRYQLLVPVIDVTTNRSALRIDLVLVPKPGVASLEKRKRYVLKITNAATSRLTDVIVEVTDTRVQLVEGSPVAKLWRISHGRTDETITPTLAERPTRHCWKIGAIEKGHTVILCYKIVPDTPEA